MTNPNEPDLFICWRVDCLTVIPDYLLAAEGLEGIEAVKDGQHQWYCTLSCASADGATVPGSAPINQPQSRGS